MPSVSHCNLLDPTAFAKGLYEIIKPFYVYISEILSFLLLSSSMKFSITYLIINIFLSICMSFTAPILKLLYIELGASGAVGSGTAS